MAAGARPFGSGGIRSWKHEKVEKGKTYEGWKCGEVVGVTMHELKDRTKPCRVAYCGPTTICPGCDAGEALTWRGFIPYYRRIDTRPMCVVIHEEEFARADGIGHLKLMLIGRGEDKYDKTWVRPHTATERYESANPQRREPQDLTLFLPVLLGVKGIISPFEFKRGPLVQKVTNPPPASDNEPSQPPINLKNRVAESYVRNAGADPSVPLVAGALDKVIDSLANPSKNGKHKRE